MSKLKDFLYEARPRDWKLFAISLFCIAIGTWNVHLDTWYNHACALFVSMAAGFSLWSSIWGPQFKDMGQRFRDMEQRWKDVQPETAAKQAAESFKAEVMDMHARGEFPPDVTIVLEEHQPPQSPPGRLN